MFNATQLAHSVELSHFVLICGFYSEITTLLMLGLINKHWDSKMLTFQYTIANEVKLNYCPD